MSMSLDLRCQYSSTLHIAITGATGYIGQHLISVYDSASFIPLPALDVPENALFIHLAANLSEQQSAVLQNVQNDLWLVDLINAKHRGLIYASGNNVYAYALDCRITDKTRCHNYYSTSKVLGEKLIQERLKTPYIIVRIGDVFGFGQRHGNFFHALETAIKNGTPLTQFGSGLKRRSYIYILELSAFLKHLSLKKFFDHNEQSIVNLCYKDSATIAEILSEITAITHLPINRIEQASDRSDLDIRTMQPGPFMEYSFLWDSFRSALKHYVGTINISEKIA